MTRVLPLAQALQLSPSDLDATFPADIVRIGDFPLALPGCLKLGYGLALVVSGEQRGATWYLDDIEGTTGSPAAPSFEAHLRSRLVDAIDATSSALAALESRLAYARSTLGEHRRRPPGKLAGERLEEVEARVKLGVFLGSRRRQVDRALVLLEGAFSDGAHDYEAGLVQLGLYEDREAWDRMAVHAARMYRDVRHGDAIPSPKVGADPTRRMATLLYRASIALGRLGHVRDALLAARASMGLQFHDGLVGWMGSLFLKLGFEERGHREIERSPKAPIVVGWPMDVVPAPAEAIFGPSDGFVRSSDVLPASGPDRPSRRVFKHLPRANELPNVVEVTRAEVEAHERRTGAQLPQLYREDLLHAGSLGTWCPEVGRLPCEYLAEGVLLFGARGGKGGIGIGADPSDGQPAIVVDRGPQRESIWKFDREIDAFVFSDQSYGHYLSRIATSLRALEGYGKVT
jgi:hypothetical protein